MLLCIIIKWSDDRTIHVIIYLLLRHCRLCRRYAIVDRVINRRRLHPLRMRNVIFYTHSTGRVRPQRSLILYFEDRASSQFPCMMAPLRMWLFKVAPRRVLEGLLG